MTPEEIKGLQDIQGTLGYRVIQAILDKRLTELDSVTNIDPDKPNIEAKAIGRALAVKWCKDIKSEINLSTPSDRDIKRTYE